MSERAGFCRKVNYESRAEFIEVCVCVFGRFDLAPLFVVLLSVDRLMKEEQSETLAPPQ